MGNRVSKPREHRGPFLAQGPQKELVTKRDWEQSCERVEHRYRRREKYELRGTAAKVIPWEAVARCGQHLVRKSNNDANVTVFRADNGRAHYSGLVTCGSVWHCPVCAAKISEGRRVEIADLVKKHQAAGGSVYMATLTAPHSAFDQVGATKKMVAKAWQKVQASASWKRAKAAAGFVGSVRSLEVTHGANGWHPHIHLLIFVTGGNPTAEKTFGDFLYDRWKGCIAAAGGGKTTQWAYKFEACASAEEAGDYVAKWGPDAEMTKGHMKLAEGPNRTPWQILNDIRDNWSPRDVRLFRDYAEAFKGARQLTWSKGLRELYGEEAGDDDLATAEPVESVAVAQLNAAGFELVKSRGLVPDLLEAIERHGGAGAIAFAEGFRLNLSIYNWINHDVGSIDRTAWPSGKAA